METLTKDFSTGAIVWYNFKSPCNILYLYSCRQDDSVCSFLKRKGCVNSCNITQLNDLKSVGRGYDYIVGIDILEESKSPVELLKQCHNLLSSAGRFLLGTENRYAIKYICGDRDPYTNHSFDGIENYRRLSDADRGMIAGRCYSMAELTDMLDAAGFSYNRFYSAMPSLQETQLVYAHDYVPVEELAMRYFPLYNYPDSVFLEEQFLYTDLIKNGMFHKLANAYIIECSPDGAHDDTLHATISLDRGPENALVTSICERDGVKTVSKRAVYGEGTKKLKEMQDNLKDLRDRGINVVDSYIDGDCFMMPFVDAPIAMNALKELTKRDKDSFFKALDDMYELVLQSSDYTDEIPEKDRNSANGRDLGVILERGYIDMVPLNCFYDASVSDSKSRFIYYDQEFYVRNCPAKAIMYRSVSIIYDGTDKGFERLVPRAEVLERYGLAECEDIWMRMSSRFTERFLFQFAGDYEVYSIIDNNSSKWGAMMHDIPINSPDILKDIPEEERHIIICIKGYNGVVNQLKGMGIADYHIYDPGNDYPNKRKERVAARLAAGTGTGTSAVCRGTTISDANSGAVNESSDDKPYNVGYIAGVFDLFHIGHLNMFKRAKEQCRYLIVGVVSDEGVRLNKQAEPFVPFEERIEMVRSCRYVDEAIKLPLDFCGTRDIFKLYHFDVQFSGSDYEHDPAWLAEKEFLEKNGATMVFFPYTKSTSSTKLKRAIEGRING